MMNGTQVLTGTVHAARAVTKNHYGETVTILFPRCARPGNTRLALRATDAAITCRRCMAKVDR